MYKHIHEHTLYYYIYMRASVQKFKIEKTIVQVNNVHQEGAGCTGGETEKERKCRASRDRTMELVYHGSQFLPPHLHMHTLTHTPARAHTCHVLLLFITIIVTTGIVFVQFKSIGHRSLQKKKNLYTYKIKKYTYRYMHLKAWAVFTASSSGRRKVSYIPIHIETLTTILFQNIVVLGFNFTQCNMRLEHGARTL